ncbi:MAG: 4Fe-4S double cluster binding domain-containing protein [bacterium]|nr:4Fe-4S double cluster binding domain-containing protein [bacterium]
MPQSKAPGLSTWLDAWMQARNVPLWGVADLQGFATPTDASGRGFAAALAFALPMDRAVMASIQTGPNQAYADLYASVNGRINEISIELAADLRQRGIRALALAASKRTDPVNIRGDFPHKTAATRAGIGWIGRNCQLITRSYGPWVRLGTVFTDFALKEPGPALERSFCGTCTACISACPAGALQGAAWSAGLAREAQLDAQSCDTWKKTHYSRYHKGHNCGICSAVCPHGLKTLAKGRGRQSAVCL